MIDFTEIKDWEVFEDLCESLLIAEGLKTRRLGRGPGQLGKDIVAQEPINIPLSGVETRDWLVECKFTDSNGAIDENDVKNVRDRVESQNAYGYMLFTNARLRVNLEKTLNGLKVSKKIGIVLWQTEKIEREIIKNTYVFKKYFPISFSKWISENCTIILSNISKIKSPLVHVLNYLQLLYFDTNNRINLELKNQILNKQIFLIKGLLQEIDTSIKLLELENVSDENCHRE